MFVSTKQAKPHILFFTQTSSAQGGVERWLDDLVGGLIQQGFKVSIALADGFKFHKATEYLQLHPQLHKANIHILNGRFAPEFSRSKLIERVIRKQKPDIIVPVLLEEALEVAIKLKHSGSLHHIIYPVHENGVWVYDVIQKFHADIDVICSVNQLFVDCLTQLLNLPLEKLVRIRCGVSKVGFDNDRNRGASLRIGYCGSLNNSPKRAKNIIGLLTTLDESDVKYTLDIAGSGVLENELKQSLADKVNAGEVRFLGYLSKNDLDSLFYQEIDVLFLPSLWETGPIVAWEAMMSGVVLISSRYRGLRKENILLDGETALLFDVGDFRYAAKQVVRLAQDEELFSTLSNNARKLAEQELTVEKMVNLWSELFITTQEKDICMQSKGAIRKHRLSSHIKSSVEFLCRRIFNRPIYHGDSHSEWPRYLPGHVSRESIERFDDLLMKIDQGKRR